MSMKKMLGTMLPLMLAMQEIADNPVFSHTKKSKVRRENVTGKKPMPPIPKGCERFYYNSKGRCGEREMEVYFDAMTGHNAFKKFEKWLIKNKNL